jgi:putative chitinase
MSLSNALTVLGIDLKWEKPLQAAFTKYDINILKRQAAFIGQCAHESGNFKTLEENLHYKTESLMKVWPSRFPDIATAAAYANNPQRIADKVYGGRMGNGTEETGDGWKYHGRGLIQLTGKENYERCGSAIGVNLVEQPSLLVEPNYAAMSAGWFWNKKGLNELADAQEHGQITKRINGGLIGLDDRIAKTTKALEALG